MKTSSRQLLQVLLAALLHPEVKTGSPTIVAQASRQRRGMRGWLFSTVAIFVIRRLVRRILKRF